MAGLTLVKVQVLYFLYVLSGTWSISVNDPRLRVGHLQPLGTGSAKVPVESAVAYPTPEEFFEQYVDKQRPLVLRGVARAIPAFKLWGDDYFLGLPELNSTQVAVEFSKKEIPGAKPEHVTVKDFITKFKNRNAYLVDVMPILLRKDVLIPSPLRCQDSAHLLEDVGLWYSSGGTSSTLHGDDQDDIRCVLKGRHEYLIFNYASEAKKLVFPEFKLQSSVDVDRVDFEKFPGLANLTYYSATLDAGDCLYTPYRWFHQIRTHADNSDHCIAINFWFNHKHNHRPKLCDIKPEEATLDKYNLRVDSIRGLKPPRENEDDNHDGDGHDEEEHDNHDDHDDHNGNRNDSDYGDHENDLEQNRDDDDGNDGHSTGVEDNEHVITKDQFYGSMDQLRAVARYIRKKESKGGLSFAQFLSYLKSKLLKSETGKALKVPVSFENLVKHLAELIDQNNDGRLSLSEFESVLKLPKEQSVQVVHTVLRINFCSHDFLEFTHHGGKDEEFEDFRKGKIEERKNMYFFKEEL